MAARKNYQWLLNGGAERFISPMNPNPQLEFDEAEIWCTNEVPSSEGKRVVMNNSRPLKRPIKKSSSHIDQSPIAAKSLPVNIPDWSKILGREYKDQRVDNSDDVVDDDGDGDDDDDRDNRIPPHVYLARTRVASFSVHEGLGRTLKGRDLSRVRNAIWKQTGFED